MKTLATLFGGIVTITETGGVFAINVVKSGQVGGGLAKGILSVSENTTITVSQEVAEGLVNAEINKIVPSALLGLAEEVETIAEGAVKAIE